MPVLSTHVQLLLLIKATLPRPPREVQHPVHVRVLQPQLPHKEQPDHAQEPPTPKYQRHAAAAAQDRHQEPDGASHCPPAAPSSSPTPADFFGGGRVISSIICSHSQLAKSESTNIKVRHNLLFALYSGTHMTNNFKHCCCCCIESIFGHIFDDHMFWNVRRSPA